jgi:hypothetical protein
MAYVFLNSGIQLPIFRRFICCGSKVKNVSACYIVMMFQMVTPGFMKFIVQEARANCPKKRKKLLLLSNLVYLSLISYPTHAPAISPARIYHSLKNSYEKEK